MIEKVSIDRRYSINPGHIKRINEFKEFIGEDKFNEILGGVAIIDIPLEEDQFVYLMKIFLDKEPDCGYFQIPYSDADEIISFFCKPFAGKLLRRAQSMLNGISSTLQKMDPELIKTAMESISFREKNGITSGVSSSQTETKKEQSESMKDTPQQGLQG